MTADLVVARKPSTWAVLSPLVRWRLAPFPYTQAVARSATTWFDAKDLTS